ncbi:pantoate--beta-alanine ligase [Luteimicrobium subarcticum]|uniref:Pantothenate synthetase n=1 Tax=Luteimicrobium subarcticum TaxID=620910 RepID=A0A2M8WSR2_9MICO|nr:pantoate--beta-alanine ligase [Luteimicrobium subarcticum]PJI93948.1 pantothenate synthetase [Luteimicrobium subarcticum]
MTEPLLVTTREALADALAGRPDAADATAGGRRAVVMTMGALHDGHLTLVRRARELVGGDGTVVVTIFVNPLQFGAGEDLDAYPRDLDGDLAKVASVGADVVFAPTPDVVYPDGGALVRVSAGPLGSVLEGASRPGHFDGMLTVVLKLMHLVAPDVALFGEKDAQQLLLVRRMVVDLDVPVDVVGVPIVREPDGLAMSSRNAYLSSEERGRALALSRALAAGVAAADAGGSAQDVVGAAAETLNAADGVVVDYLALVDPDTVEDLQEVAGAGSPAAGPALLLVAARVGTTRLIDNRTVVLAG